VVFFVLILHIHRKIKLTSKAPHIIIRSHFSMIRLYKYIFTKKGEQCCGNLSAQKMTELGNIILAPSSCNEVQEETIQEFLCLSNFTVLNKTIKFSSKQQLSCFGECLS
jgi:hypothetical protein